ncbi:DUF4166 domain-containing protein [Leucobacter sp. CSA1]|uniref:DUF4166 domain-containing protein n=1 Tax=Leucobacter chromiisoli TaxID=2796471 RepID=A0A934UU73_9MICO|nr:DUF4166 domain-containing protein [Leucobacter chromiisoli]MBK0418520.1 DUF4166 domain-containing protein [Leucobacter chromiisoli]
MNARESVFTRVLGEEEVRRLRPEVFEYVAGPPRGDDDRGSHHGVGEGVFEIAGSPYRRLVALLRPFTGPDLLVSRYERNVPFTVVNRPLRLADGSLALAAERIFRFRSGEQRFVDVLYGGGPAGALRNVLGARGRIELELVCAVTAEGHLRMESRGTRLRVGRRSVRLPRLLSVLAEVEDGYDAARGVRTISAAVRNPVLGTVVEYRGSFTYAYRG